MEAKTIHRLLEVEPSTGRFARNESNPLDCEIMVMDETSMVDVVLMHSALKAAPQRASLILVGDVDQLPSVGPGNVLRDLIDCERVPVLRLTEVFRQAAGSRARAGSAVGAGRREPAPPERKGARWGRAKLQQTGTDQTSGSSRKSSREVAAGRRTISTEPTDTRRGAGV